MKQPRREDSGHRTRTKSNNLHKPGLKSQMESILSLVAGWVSEKEMKALQGACMRISVMAREQQYEEILSDLDGQVWEELSDDWQKKKVPPCEPKRWSPKMRRRSRTGTQASPSVNRRKERQSIKALHTSEIVKV